MALAGLKQRALARDRISLEQMLTRPPDLMLRSNYRAGQYSAEQRWLSHRIVRGSRSPNLHTDGRRWTCMGPTLISEVLRLRRATS
jgi:iron complex transport system substrate-binding protein